MDGDWQGWFLVTCPLWTGWLLLLYSIYNIQRHVSIKSLIFFKLWITRITLLVWMPGRFRTKMKNMVNKSPNKRESYKVHTINFLLLPSLPLPVHQLQPMGRPALPDLLLGLRASKYTSDGKWLCVKVYLVPTAVRRLKINLNLICLMRSILSCQGDVFFLKS